LGSNLEFASQPHFCFWARFLSLVICSAVKWSAGEVCGVLLELARPVTLLCSMLSLLAVFHTAFLGAEMDYSTRIYDSLGVLLLAAGFSLVGGLVCLEDGRENGERLRKVSRVSRRRKLRIIDTFPVQVFCWTTGIMAVLFVLSWYLETHCIFYRDIHF
jgi:hypothetical protein